MTAYLTQEVKVQTILEIRCARCRAWYYGVKVKRISNDRYQLELDPCNRCLVEERWNAQAKAALKEKGAQ